MDQLRRLLEPDKSIKTEANKKQNKKQKTDHGQMRSSNVNILHLIRVYLKWTVWKENVRFNFHLKYVIRQKGIMFLIWKWFVY